MQRKEWITLKRLKDEDDFSKLEIGERFLYGGKMVEQVARPGESIWYYQVIRFSETGTEYMPVFDILEKDREVQDFKQEEQ